MKKHIIFLAFTAAALASCYKSDDGKAAEVEPRFVIEDSSDPLDHARYEIFRSTGVYLFYDYEEVDYKWNMEAMSSNILVKQTDRNILTEALEYIDKVLFDYYTDEFARRYFPFRIFMARQVNNVNGVASLQDRVAASGRGYLALGRLDEETMPRTSGQINRAKGEVNGVLWGNIIYGHGLVEIPENFFAVSEGYYELDLDGDPAKDDPATLYKLGFWNYDKTQPGLTDYKTPGRAGDIHDFVELITSSTAEEMEVLMGSYNNLRQKYTILLQAVKQATGVDLQKIGENKPSGNDI